MWQTKGGQLIPIQRNVSPIKGHAGEIIGAAITVRDISGRKRSEAQQRLASSVFNNTVEAIIVATQ